MCETSITIDHCLYQVQTPQLDWIQRQRWFNNKVASTTGFQLWLSFSPTAGPTPSNRLHWQLRTCTQRCQRLVLRNTNKTLLWSVPWFDTICPCTDDWTAAHTGCGINIWGVWLGKGEVTENVQRIVEAEIYTKRSELSETQNDWMGTISSHSVPISQSYLA